MSAGLYCRRSGGVQVVALSPVQRILPTGRPRAPARGGRVRQLTKGHHHMTIRQKLATIVLGCAVLSGGARRRRRRFGQCGAGAEPCRSRHAPMRSPPPPPPRSRRWAPISSPFGSATCRPPPPPAWRSMALALHALGPAPIDHIRSPSCRRSPRSACRTIATPARSASPSTARGSRPMRWAQAGFDLAHHSTTQLRNAAPRTIDHGAGRRSGVLPRSRHAVARRRQLIVHAPYRGHPVEVGEVSSRRVKRVKFGDPSALSAQPWIGPSASRSDGVARPVRRAMISAQIEIAVSSGVRAPRSRPIGDINRSICSG